MFAASFVAAALSAFAVATVKAAPTNTTGTEAAQFSGDATWFEPGLGACGATSSASDLIVALSPSEYQSGAHCFQHIGVNFQGRFVDATVVDLCPGCGPGSIDLSPAAFQQLASLDVGRIQVTWNFE